jgi:hypothetical protein
MDMYQSEKNLLEKLADAIPGLKGYREKEARRDTDKRFREYLAGRIDRVKNGLEEIKRKELSEGRLDGLDDWDRLGQKLAKVSNSIRFASYGYSGFFDQVKIEEGELDRIYQHDLSLISEVEALENALKNDPSLLEVSIGALEKRVDDRKNLFTVTG